MKNTSTHLFIRRAISRPMHIFTIVRSSIVLPSSFGLILIFTSFTAHSQNCEFAITDISGPTNACAYSGSVGGVATYSVSAIGPVAFVWSVPVQATLLSGQGTNSISVKYKNTFVSGSISVTATSTCSSEVLTVTMPVTKALPARPASILGDAIVCDQVNSGTAVVYSIEPVADAVSYRWAVPGQTTILSGQGTQSITVLFTSKFKSGDIKVRSVSGCGTSIYRNLTVTSKGPITPGLITGKAQGICPDEVVEYSINPALGATSYNWSTSVPGATIVEDGTKAKISFPSFISGTVNVTAVNSCGNSGTRRLTVTTRGLSPGEIIGPDSVCQATVHTFSVDSVPGAVAYNWSVPEGSSITSGDGTRSITVQVGSAGGVVSVRAATLCDPGEAVNLSLEVDPCGVTEEPLCELSVFPVPTTDVVHVAFCAELSGDYHLTVADPITGCILICSKGTYKAGENDIKTDLSNLKDGNYLLKIVTNEFAKTQRVEVRHCAGR